MWWSSLPGPLPVLFCLLLSFVGFALAQVTTTNSSSAGFFSPSPSSSIQVPPTTLVGFDHSAWDHVLAQYVITGQKLFDVSGCNVVDYQALRRHPHEEEYLHSYLVSLASADLTNISSSRQETLAFWTNAYNALAVKLITENPCKAQFGKFCWPIRSIRDIGAVGSSVWDYTAGTIGGKEYTLNNIQDTLRALKDPRTHTAIVGATASGPNIQPFAFLSDQIEQQLNLTATLFLNSTEKGLSLDKAKHQLKLSPIFDWFNDDFVTSPTYGSVINFVVAHLDTNSAYGRDVKAFIQTQEHFLKITYFDFNWQLNSKANAELYSISFY